MIPETRRDEDKEYPALPKEGAGAAPVLLRRALMGGAGSMVGADPALGLLAGPDSAAAQECGQFPQLPDPASGFRARGELP